MPEDEKGVPSPMDRTPKPSPGAFGGSHRVLLDSVSDMVTITGRDGRIVYANAATERVSGYTPEEFASLGPFDRMHPEDRPRCEEAFRRLLGTPGLSVDLEHRVKHKDGSWRWVEGTFRSLFEDPDVGGLVATVRDVSTRKEAEGALRESEERQAFLLRLNDALRPLVDSAEIKKAAASMIVEYLGANRAMYLEIDGDGDMAEAVISGQYARAVPLFPSRVPYAAFAKGFPTEVLESNETLVVVDTASDPRLTDSVRAAWLGTQVAAAVAVSLVKENRMVGNFGLHSAVAREWTPVEIQLVEETAERTWAAVERARAEEALRESEERYRLAVEAADLGRWELVPETGEFYTSPTCNRHLGLPEDARLTHKEHFENIHPDDHATIYERLRRAAEEGGEFEAEYRVTRPEGGVRRILSRARMLRNPGSAPDSLTGVTLDVTEARELEEERERSRALELTSVAEASERERISRELHDRVAHHMAVAHQSLELFAALRDASPEHAAEKLDLARRTTRLALDQTRALSAELKRLQDDELAEGLEAAFGKLAESYVPDDVEMDASFSGDESAIPGPVGTQAYLTMREAVRNAVKHSGCSRIGVTLEALDGELRGLVEDDGEGFDAKAVARATPSWGVGLRSMRERVEMLGGTLRVDAEPGEGTRVEIRVPLDGHLP